MAQTTTITCDGCGAVINPDTYQRVSVTTAHVVGGRERGRRTVAKADCCNGCDPRDWLPSVAPTECLHNCYYDSEVWSDKDWWCWMFGCNCRNCSTCGDWVRKVGDGVRKVRKGEAQ